MEDKNTLRGIYFFNDIADVSKIKQQVTNHRFMAIIMHKAGILQFSIEDKQYTLSHNDVLFCTPLVLSGNNYTHSSDFKAQALLLDMEEYKEVFHEMFLYEQNWWKRTLFIHNHPVMHIPSETIELASHIEAIVSHISQYTESRYSPKMLQSLLQIFVCMLMARIDELMKQEDDELGTEKNNLPQLGRSELIFKDFLVLLNEKRPRSRFCSWYAEQLCITEKHLSSICKRVSGKTATQWINEMVTEDIRHLLLHSELSIKEIAVQLEFPNLSFFGKYTKQHLGCSPKHFREQVKA